MNIFNRKLRNFGGAGGLALPLLVRPEEHMPSGTQVAGEGKEPNANVSTGG